MDTNNWYFIRVEWVKIKIYGYLLASHFLFLLVVYIFCLLFVLSIISCNIILLWVNTCAVVLLFLTRNLGSHFLFLFINIGPINNYYILNFSRGLHSWAAMKLWVHRGYYVDHSRHQFFSFFSFLTIISQFIYQLFQ